MTDETRRDSGAAPTRRDDEFSARMNPGGAATRLDGGRAAARHSVFQLPSALAQRFRIIEPLPTAGAEAELLLVDSVQTAERAVVKLYRPGIQPKTQVLEQVGRIAPEDVVRLIEHGQSDGVWYEVLEYCRFGSLRRFLRGHAIPAEYVQRMFVELFRALAHVHQAGIIHRDLKPENVLIRATDPLDLVLTDFGIASLAEASQHFTTAARTVKYGAPEAASGVIGTKADYWSLGMMLLEALTGRHPFEGLSEPVINRNLATRPVDVSAVADERWQLLCRGLLHRDPEERWGAEEVQRWLDGDSALAVAFDEEAARPAAPVAPYTIEEDRCTTARDLGIALAKHWDAGVKDLARGFVVAWVRDELKDRNLLRFLLDLEENTALRPEARLLRLVLKLAPGIPPVWRGRALTRESLRAVAAAAAAGDGESLRWIDDVMNQEVATAYAAAGCGELAELEQARAAKSTEIAAHLEQMHNAEKAAAEELARERRQDGWPPDMDELMYGGVHRKPAAPAAINADILSLVLAPDYETVLRAQVLAQCVEVSADCTWLYTLGPIEELNGAQLVAIRSCLPRAQAWVKEVRLLRARREQREREHLLNLRVRLERLLIDMHALEGAHFSDTEGLNRTNLSRLIAAFRELYAEAGGVSGAESQSLKRLLLRSLGPVNDIDRQLRSMRTWLVRMGAFSGAPLLVFFLLEVLLRTPWLLLLGLGVVGGTFLWFAWQRWRANWTLRRLIQRLPWPDGAPKLGA